MTIYQRIRIGNVIVTNGIAQLELWRSRKEPGGYVTFLFKPEVDLQVTIGSIVEVDLGYDESTAARVFTGEVSGQNVAKDSMAKLLNVKVSQSFIQASPQDMIKYVLEQAGMEEFRLAPQVFEPKNTVVAGLNGYDMIKQRIHPQWGIDFATYCDTRDVFIWRPVERPKEMFLFDDENILELMTDGDRGRMRTVFVPGLDHSQYVSLLHPRVQGIALVDTVHHYIKDEKLRTEIYYTLESG
ncbi:hypothetical protein [Paenibacillus tyrfis]|uniref:Uncharacterized protein n=1 Tax=Paenibacillus tyrfis TaxID=1501230 RepID=A0A081NYA8_9BACL|nr:hypothetical protein [Paenibacillus tyrfis]KEQ23431.1 hypothetical protein ET33_16530 [Paenibacillus tyrfis]